MASRNTYATGLETPCPKRSIPGKIRTRHVRHHSHKNVFYSQNASKASKAKAMLLAAKIRGKDLLSQPVRGTRHLVIPDKDSSPSQPVYGTRHMHVRAKSTSTLQHVFSNFASPKTLMNSRKNELQGEDSPSKNTRSQVDLVSDVLPPPKSSKRKSPPKFSKTPNKSPRRLANKATCRSRNKDHVWQQTQKMAITETPEKSEDKYSSPLKQLHYTLPQKRPPHQSPVSQSPCKMSKKRKSPEKNFLYESPVKQSPSKMAKKYPKLIVKRTPRRGWSLQRASKTTDKETHRTISSASDETTSSRKILNSSTNLIPLPKHRALKCSTTLAVSNEDKAKPPCERCFESVTHSHGSHSFSSSTTFLNPSEISTASSLDDVFESPPHPNLNSPLRKSTRKASSGTPELNRMWKQKKPHNSGSPISSKILSSKSSVRSESPIFGPEPTPSRKISTSPSALKNQPNIIIQSPAAKKMTLSPTFGKQNPSPCRKHSSKSPVSTSKQSRLVAKRTTLKQKKTNTSSPSILSFLDIKGIKTVINPTPWTLLDVADCQHGTQNTSRKRAHGEDDDEFKSKLKKQKSLQDKEKRIPDNDCGKDFDEFVDIEIDCDANDDEVLIISTPKSRINISEVATEGTSFEELQEFVSPSRKTKSILGVCKFQESPVENVMSPKIDTIERLDAQIDQNTASTESKATMHKSFKRLPTRRSLVTKMSSGDETPDPVELPSSPLFSNDSMEEDINNPSVSQILTTSADSKKKQYTPVSKKGLSDLINSPLINSLKKKTVGSKECGSRRHVSFSKE